MFKEKSILFSTVLSLLCVMASCHKKNDFDNFEKDAETESSVKVVEEVDDSQMHGVRSIKVNNIGPLWKVFNDSNYLQLNAARNLGIDPVEDLKSAYFTRRPLVRVKSCDNYHLDSLRHSLPYLVPEAANLLDEIGKNFIDSLHKRGGDSYKIKVTSVLRTPESVSKLRRVNINATDSSTHQYGTTFDISYTNFYCLNENRQINQGDLKNLLGEVLNDLRKQGKCLVKYESKTGCFHITASK